MGLFEKFGPIFFYLNLPEAAPCLGYRVRCHPVRCPGQRLALIWDGATYHRSDEMKAFLASINEGLAESDWKVTCLRFAPNDPTQNPIEDIWLSAKRYIRESYHQCKTFAAVKCLFELAVQHKIFDFPKLNRLGKFSLIT